MAGTGLSVNSKEYVLVLFLALLSIIIYYYLESNNIDINDKYYLKYPIQFLLNLNNIYLSYIFLRFIKVVPPTITKIVEENK